MTLDICRCSTLRIFYDFRLSMSTWLNFSTKNRICTRPMKLFKSIHTI